MVHGLQAWSGVVVAHWSRSTKLTQIYLILVYLVNLRQARLVLRWVTVFGFKISRYLTSRTGQLSLAIPSWVGAHPKGVTPCGWGLKAGMVRVRVAGKTVFVFVIPCYTRAISERF